MRSLHQLLLLLFFSLPAGLFAQYDLEHNLSDAEKLYGLSKFWSEATYNFAFFDQTDVNWDSAYQAFVPRVLATPNTFEYYRELKRFCALLQDGHTDVWAPDTLFQESVFIRVIFERREGKIVVANVAAADAGQVPIGSVLLQVDGKPAENFFLEEVMPFISGSTEHERWNDALRRFTYPLRDTLQTQQLRFLRPDGTEVTYAHRFHNRNTSFLRDEGDWQRFNFEMLDGDIGWVTINTFSDDGVIEDFEAVLPELLQAKGVILGSARQWRWKLQCRR